MAKKTKSAAAVADAGPPAPTPRLLELYRDTVLPKLIEQLKRKNPIICLRFKGRCQHGVLVSCHKPIRSSWKSSFSLDTNHWPEAISDQSKVAISGFKLRENLAIGVQSHNAWSSHV